MPLAMFSRDLFIQFPTSPVPHTNPPPSFHKRTKWLLIANPSGNNPLTSIKKQQQTQGIVAVVLYRIINIYRRFLLDFDFLVFALAVALLFLDFDLEYFFDFFDLDFEYFDFFAFDL